MGIHIYWENETKNIIRADFDAKWTWEDYQNSRLLLLDMINDGTAPVHRIVNMLKTKIVPDSTALLNAMQARSNARVNQLDGLTLIVGAPKVIEIFTKSLSKVYGNRSNRVLVNSIEEAYTEIDKFNAATTES